MNVVQISDTHISHLGGITNDNFRRMARFINDELRPDLVVASGDISILTPDSTADRETARQLFELIDPALRVLPGNHDVGEPSEQPWAGFSATGERTNAFTSVFGPDHWVDIVDDYAVIGFNSELLSSQTPEEEAQWQWLATVKDQVGDRPAVVFCHKPFWPPVPGETEHAMSVPGGVLDRLLGCFDGIDLVAYGSGHLHHFATGHYGDAITVSAPSTAFVVKDHEAMTGPGLNQLGVVEYRCGDGGVEVYFRSVPDLVEGSPLDVEAFNITMSELGVTVDI
jgi:3',5'-cyclic AMP phosphodiesterase CpdA